MFSILLTCLTFAAPTVGQGFPAAATELSCNFDSSWDPDFTGWPKGWSRRRGIGFPQFVRMEIGQEPSPCGGRSLCVQLNGGGATAFSPPIPITAFCEYVAEAWVKTRGLKYDNVFLSITLLDEQRQRLRTIPSASAHRSEDWQLLQVSPVPVHDKLARWVTIGLHVEPQGREDFSGTVCFGDVWLGRLPLVELKTSDPQGLYVSSSRPEITCKVIGSVPEPAEVAFELQDALGHDVAEARQPLRRQSGPGPAQAGETAIAPAIDSSTSPAGTPVMGDASWTAPALPPGFYRASATLAGGDHRYQTKQVTFAVLAPLRATTPSEFGWSLPQGSKGLSLVQLGRLLDSAGVSWIKYPMWYDDPKGPKQAELIRLLDQANAASRQVVGMLSDPPASLRKKLELDQQVTALRVLGREPKQWYPSVEPTLSRVAVQVRWWQLGGDDDASFTGAPSLGRTVAAIKTAMDPMVQDTQLGFAWLPRKGWPSTDDAKTPWRFLVLGSDTSQSPAQLAAMLDGAKDQPWRRWVVLDQMAGGSSSVAQRAANLVQRMVIARAHRADVVYAADPLADDSGMVNPDGTPGELLIPWRTTALTLAEANYLGRLTLPHDVENHVFVRDNEAIVVCWSWRPTTIALCVGSEARQLDLWGNTCTLPTLHHEHLVSVELMPSFVLGLEAPLARWQVGLSLATATLPSVPDVDLPSAVRLVNPFDRPVTGRVKIHSPAHWKIEPREIEFQLKPGDAWQQPLVITLPQIVAAGRQTVRFDFDIRADKHYRLSVYRHVEVDPGKESLRCLTRLTEQGELEVRQQMTNHGASPVQFRCELFAPGRRRLATLVDHPGQGEDVKTYRLANAAELVGKQLWLRATEVDGSRVLNYWFTVEKQR